MDLVGQHDPGRLRQPGTPLRQRMARPGGWLPFQERNGCQAALPLRLARSGDRRGHGRLARLVPGRPQAERAGSQGFRPVHDVRPAPRGRGGRKLQPPERRLRLQVGAVGLGGGQLPELERLVSRTRLERHGRHRQPLYHHADRLVRRLAPEPGRSAQAHRGRALQHVEDELGGLRRRGPLGLR
ncbi:hypothetical protein D3C87_1601010 [compost metagenome]